MYMLWSYHTHRVDRACQWLAAGQWFSPATPASSNSNTDSHDITEILLKVALKPHNPDPWLYHSRYNPMYELQSNLYSMVTLWRKKIWQDNTNES
jgi:hypothetical protein